MATLTSSQAIQNIKNFYSKYLPTYVAKDSAALSHAEELFQVNLQTGWSLKASYDFVIAQGVVAAVGFENAYPSKPVPVGNQIINPVAFANTFPASEVVNYLYPNASAATKAGLVASVTNGSLSITDFASAISITNATTSNPTVDQIKAAPVSLTITANLPDSGLEFTGVSDAQLNFLVSMYVGAFGRAPDFGGLKYWAGDLATGLNSGMTQHSAYLQIGQTMYKAGTENGEGGTQLQNAEFITFAYNNALGRAADTGGFNYWLNDLNSGNISRGNFLTTFLTAGQDNERDSSYLASRVAVSKFAAQEHVAAAGIDTKAILSGVVDQSSALTAINGIIQKYGAAPVEVSHIQISGALTPVDSLFF